MVITDDETLARHHQMGAVCHRVIARIAARTRTPSPDLIRAEILGALPHLEPNEGRAHRQNITGAVNTYFGRLLPAATWSFHGAEVALGRGRLDLLWRDPHGRLLIDELKTGRAVFFDTTANLQQGRTYVTDGRRQFGARLTGLRLLCLQHPERSLYLTRPSAPYRHLYDIAEHRRGSARQRTQFVPGRPIPQMTHTARHEIGRSTHAKTALLVAP